MIIEDDLIIGENLKENLEELGYIPVGVATNYRESIKLFAEEQPDLCMVDIYLKGSAKNGIDTIYELKEQRELPIIYLTSFDDLEIREKAKKTNPSAYLIKPASKQQIDVAIDFALTNFNKAQLPDSIDDNHHHCPYLAGKGYFFLKVKEKYIKILTKDIVYLRASGSYCDIFTSVQSYTVSSSLKGLLINLNHESLFRCHRSYAININFIQSFDESNLYLSRGLELVHVQISSNHRRELLDYLPKLKL